MNLRRWFHNLIFNTVLVLKRRKNAGLLVSSICLLSTGLVQSASHVTTETDDVFTADQLVTWVWQQNPGVAELNAAAEVAVHRIEPAGALDDPTLGYVFAPETLGTDGGNGQGLNQKVEFSQKIPWPGTLAARQSVAEHHAEMAQQDIELLRLQLAATAKSAYAEWYFIQRSLQIHHATRQLLKELRAAVEVRYAAGKSLQQDVLHVEVEEAKLDRHLLQLKRIEASVKAQINALLNRGTTSLLPKPDGIVNLTMVPVLSDLEREALISHPELRRIDSQVSVNSSEVDLAQKAFYPDLRFTAGYNSLWNDPDKRTMLGLSINIPLDGGKRKAALNGAKASARRARSQLDNLSAQLTGELSQAHAATVESVDAVQLYEKRLLPLAHDYFEAALTDYESGTGSFLSVITAEREKLAIEEALERSRADLLRHTAMLERWTGRTMSTFSTRSLPSPDEIQLGARP